MLGTWPGGQPWRASFSFTFAFSLPPFLLSPSFYKGVWALAQSVLVISSQNLTFAKPLATFLQVHNISLGGSVSTACCPLHSQAPLSLGFPRQEDWSELPFASPRDLLDPGIEPGSPVLQADSVPFETPGKPPSPWNLLETLPQTQEIVFRYLRRERVPSQLATLKPDDSFDLCFPILSQRSTICNLCFGQFTWHSCFKSGALCPYY